MTSTHIIESQPLTSMDITALQHQKLKALFPEVFTEGGKIDFDKLRLTLGETVDVGKERFGLNWADKSDCFKTIQQASIATLVPARDESVNFDNTENLYIEGDNLEVLKLLQKSYLGKVKMIYIDPPYNTGNDFIYPDNYAENLSTYLEYTGQVDGEGRAISTNKDTDGRFHSKWLNMMYPRLFLAKNLLREDGVIFISIDDNEVHNLRALCNEIFGEENFIANVVWERAYSPVNLKKHFSENHDFLLCYSKSNNLVCNGLKRSDEAIERYQNLDNDFRGVWQSDNLSVAPAIAAKIYPIITPNGREILPPSGRCWLYTQNRLDEMIADNRIWFGSDGGNVPRVKRFLSDVKDSVTPMTIWKYSEVGHSQEATQSLKRLFDDVAYFDYPKPVGLIKRCLELYSNDNDIILDFFSGSATTAHAVLDLNKEDGGNRKFIMVQLPEPCDENSEAFKAGYKNIAEIGKERIRRVINKIKTEQAETAANLGFKVFKLQKSNFNVWDASIEKDAESIQRALEAAINHIDLHALPEAILFELLLKSGFELTVPIESVSIENKTIFSVAAGELLVCLEKELTHELLKTMAERKPKRVICLDAGFQNNDQLKTNAVLNMKNHGVIFRTV